MNQAEVDFNRMRFFIRPYETRNLSFPAKKRREIQTPVRLDPRLRGDDGKGLEPQNDTEYLNATLMKMEESIALFMCQTTSGPWRH